MHHTTTKAKLFALTLLLLLSFTAAWAQPAFTAEVIATDATDLDLTEAAGETETSTSTENTGSTSSTGSTGSSSKNKSKDSYDKTYKTGDDGIPVFHVAFGGMLAVILFILLAYRRIVRHGRREVSDLMRTRKD